MSKKLRGILLKVLVIAAMACACITMAQTYALSGTGNIEVYGEGTSTSGYSLLTTDGKQKAFKVVANKGAVAKVKVDASAKGVTFKWYYKDKGSSKYVLTNSFKGNTYSVTMNDARNGRKIYCVVKDKSGNSVKTAVATLVIGNPLKITKHPIPVVANKGTMAKVGLTAKGDGLTYKWYYKNADSSKFYYTSSFKGNSYYVTMDSTRNKRQVYCVVTDKYGISYKTKTVTLYHGTPLQITKQPQSVVAPKGTVANVSFDVKGNGLTYKWYYKDAGQSAFTLTKTYTGNSYAAKMDASRNGRQVYCVITDRYGFIIKTDIVALYQGTPLQIKKQPVSVKALCGAKAEVSFDVAGDGLTYKWYFKDKDALKYSYTSTFPKNSYWVKMDDTRNGRQLFCIITDKYGLSVQTKTVKLTTAHEYDKGVVTVTANCNRLGEKVYTCARCQGKKIETFGELGHKMSDWAVYREPTAEQEGVERSSCSKCSYYKDRSIAKLKAKFYITADTGVGEPMEIGVGSNGIYKLYTPKKEGYTFLGWQTEAGAPFAASGVVTKAVHVSALWEITPTKTLDELVKRTDAGAAEILIAEDIIVNKPIYISYNTKIYADGNYTLRRAETYTGDIFVVGRTRREESALNLGRKAVLNLGGGKGTLTIDGNKEAVTVDVLGSMVFVADSATLNLYDGASIRNNKKVGNERLLRYDSLVGAETLSRAGGAGIINFSGTVNMYGGVLEDHLVVTEHTILDNEDGTQTWKDYNGCGGALYNRGDFNMYGGTVADNEALRGGGIYSDRIARMEAGVVSGNIAHSYGGGFSSSSTSNSDIFLGSEEGKGTLVFENNRARNSGGAVYSNLWSPIVIYGNAEFNKNFTESSGGAVYTAGPLTIQDADFKENEALGSGGAIYHYYSNPDYHRRFLEIESCRFEGNQGGLGGALILSASATATEQGSHAIINDSQFIGNKAVLNENGGNGTGGALYITRKGEAIIKNCSFEQNTAENSAGAIAVQSQSEVELADSTLQGNSAVTGGAISANTATGLQLTDVVFDGNATVLNAKGGGGNGGAIYAFDAEMTFKNVDFYNNTAAYHAGGIYQTACSLDLDSTCEFIGNRAENHGGAFYLTYKTLEDKTKVGSVLNCKNVTFKDNSAAAGGAISARSACEVNLTGGTLENNAATGTGNDASGGGAIYVGVGEAKLTNVTASGNTSAGYGGVVNGVYSTVTVEGGSYTANSAGSGGAFNGYNNATLNIKDATLNDNASTNENTAYNTGVGGGAVNVNGCTLQIANTTLEGNTSCYYGGAILAGKSTVQIDGNTTVRQSEGGTGGALYFRNQSNVTLENITLSENTARSNGVVYVNNGTLKMDQVTAGGNTAYNGGVLYASGANANIELNDSIWSGNRATLGGTVYLLDGTMDINGGELKENTAELGGAVFNRLGTLNAKGVAFSKNAAVVNRNGANGSGGVINITGGTFNTDATTTFTENSADSHGGVAHVSYFTNEDKSKVPGVLNAIGTTFEKNTAMGGGAISVRTDCEAILDGVTLNENRVSGFTDKDDGNAEGGGAVYVGFGSVTLKDVTATANKAEGFGGVVDGFTADITISGGTFHQNEANNGGAIYGVSNKSLEITNATFTENKSTYVNTDYNNTIGGGAIHLGGGTLDISNTTLDSNSSGYYGGSVMAAGAVVTIDQNTVVKNSTGGTGAALHFRNGCTVTMEDVTITDNTATKNGVVYANGGSLTANRVVATANEASGGGVFYISGGSTQAQINESSLTENKAGTGGVLYADASTVTFNGGVVQKNTASNGGAVYAKNAVITMETTDVSENTAASRGGALTTHGGALHLKNITLQKNEAAANGGVGYLTKTEVVLENASFDHNTAGTNGGALYINAATATATGDCAFTNNSAVGHGGALYVVYAQEEGDAEPVRGSMNMVGGSFQKNTAMGGGAVSIRTGCKATFDGTTFTENAVSGFTNENDGDGEGGGVAYVGFGTLTLKNVTATSNTAELGGVVDSYNAAVTIDGGAYEKNSALSGGAIYAPSGSEIHISNATLTANEATDPTVNGAVGGGAVNIAGGTLEISKTTLDGNKTAYYGGAISANTTTVQIKDSSTISNASGATGAALYFRGGSHVTMEDTALTQNASRANGVIYINSGSLVMNRVSASGNSALQGGVLYASGASTKVELNDSAWSSNNATNGGALYFIESDVSVQGGSYSENSAVLGGVAYNRMGTLEVNDVTFHKNRAEFNKNNAGGNGGVVTLEGGTLTSSGNAAFTENTAAGHGGAVYVSYFNKEDQSRASGVLNMVGGSFQKNTALAGGAVSVRSNSEATFDGTTFTENAVSGFTNENDGDGEGGGVAYVGFGTLTLKNVTATSNTAELGGVVDSYKSKVTINGGLYEKNEAVQGGAIFVPDTGTLDIADAQFDANKSTYANTEGNNAIGGGAISIHNGTLNLNKTKLTNNSTGYYGGALLADNSTVTINQQSEIAGNNGRTGAALQFINGCVVTMEDSSVTSNKATGNGVVYTNSGSLTMNRITVSGNESYNGGLLYASNGKTQIDINDSTIQNNTASYGGAIVAKAAKVSILGGKLSGNSAESGGVLLTENAKVTVDGTELSNNTATNHGGVAYIDGGTFTLKNSIVKENAANKNGGAAYLLKNEATITNTTFEKNTAANHGGALDIVGAKVTADGGTFTENTAAGHGGAFYVVYVQEEGDAEPYRGSLNMTNGTFTKNAALGGGVASIRTGCEATFDGSVFTENTASGFANKNDGDGEGGGALYVGFGAATLKNVTATGNASEWGGVVDSYKGTITVEGGSFEQNKSVLGGVICAQNSSVVNVSDAQFKANESTYENTEFNNTLGGGAVYIHTGSLQLGGTTLEDNKTGYYGGALLVNEATVTIDQNSVFKNHSAGTGAALQIVGKSDVTIKNSALNDNTASGNGVIYINGGILQAENITASGNKATQGGLLFMSGGSTNGTFKNSTFTGNTATRGGALYVTDAIFDAEGCTFTENTATLGGAVHAYNNSFGIKDCTFTKNSATKDSKGNNGNGGAAAIVGGTLDVQGNTLFQENTAENHGGAVYASYITNADETKKPGILNMVGGVFEKNTAHSGGAISARTASETTLNGTILRENKALAGSESAAEGGGALYTNNNKMTLIGVTLEANEVGYYGGALSALSAELTISDTSFIGNKGVTGVAIHMRDVGLRTLDNVIVKDNKATANGSGVIYITGSGTLDITKLNATGNENNNGGVLYASGAATVSLKNSELSGNTAKNFGGAIDHRGKVMEIIDSTISGNTAKNGGAIYTSGSGSLAIKNTTIKENNATQKGGAIHALIKNLSISEDSVLESNTAAAGGAIFIDQGAVANLANATLKLNSATAGDGGAILIADSSDEGTAATTLQMNTVTLQENVASNQGGALSTDEASPNLVIDATNCLFKANSATAKGGGAVEIKNANQNTAEDPEKVLLVFTNCTFEGNIAKTTGAGIEIRTSSCAKIDGITATDNKAADNGGVVYVTSVHSRLYLTGEVTASGNTAKNGAFAFLYNASYANPPKIYTTHSSDAAWYSDVKGNYTNVAFDLTTMP